MDKEEFFVPVSMSMNCFQMSNDLAPLFHRNVMLVFIFIVRGLSLGVFQGFFVYTPEVSYSI